MPSIAVHLGKCTKQAPVRRHDAITGAATAAVLCGSVLLSSCQPSTDAAEATCLGCLHVAPVSAWRRSLIGAPPAVSTLRGLL
jgi:hypothetical protein